MKFHSIGAGAALLSNDLANANDITFPHQEAAVVPIGTDVDVIVLEDNQLTEAHNARASVDHGAIGDRFDGVTAVAANINTLVGAA